MRRTRFYSLPFHLVLRVTWGRLRFLSVRLHRVTKLNQLADLFMNNSRGDDTNG